MTATCAHMYFTMPRPKHLIMTDAAPRGTVGRHKRWLPGTLPMNGRTNVGAELQVGRKIDEILNVLYMSGVRKRNRKASCLCFVLKHLFGERQDNRKTADVSKQQMGRATSQRPDVKTQTRFWSKQKVYLEKAYTFFFSNNQNV